MKTNISKKLIDKAMEVDLKKRKRTEKNIKESSIEIMVQLKEDNKIEQAWGFMNYIQDCMKNGEIELAKNHVERKINYLEEE